MTNCNALAFTDARAFSVATHSAHAVPCQRAPSLSASYRTLGGEAQRPIVHPSRFGPCAIPAKPPRPGRCIATKPDISRWRARGSAVIRAMARWPARQRSGAKVPPLLATVVLELVPLAVSRRRACDVPWQSPADQPLHRARAAAFLGRRPFPTGRRLFFWPLPHRQIRSSSTNCMTAFRCFTASASLGKRKVITARGYLFARTGFRSPSL